MSRFIGVDYSTASCGLAVFDGSWHTFTAKSKGVRGEALDSLYWRLGEQAYAALMMVDLGPGDVWAIERPFYGASRRGVDTLQYAFHRFIERALQWRLPAEITTPVLVNSGSLKVLATGYGKASKDDMVHAAKVRLGIAPANDDEADAAWLAVAASISAGTPIKTLPLPTGADGKGGRMLAGMGMN